MITRLLSLLLACSFLGFTGCKTGRTDGEPDSMSSIDVPQVPSDVLYLTIAYVLKENGYEVGKSTVEEMMFEKQATTMQDLAYGGWGSGPAWSRVRIRTKQLVDGGYRIDMTASWVRDRGSKSMEEEKPVSKLGGGPFRTLLKEIRSKLSEPSNSR